MFKRKRVSLSLRDKLSAIERVRRGDAKAKIALDMGVGESTICGWVKSEDKLHQFVFKVDKEKMLFLLC